MTCLHEKINPKKYNYQIESLYSKLKHMLVNEFDINQIVKVYKDTNTGKNSNEKPKNNFFQKRLRVS